MQPQALNKDLKKKEAFKRRFAVELPDTGTEISNFRYKEAVTRRFAVELADTGTKISNFRY